MWAAIDFGITNTDVVVRRRTGLDHIRLTTTQHPILDQLRSVIRRIEDSDNQIEEVAVTGGRYRELPEHAGSLPITKVNEIQAIGCGGLFLAKMEEALVVSAGSGTAMVAARNGSAVHVTGSAVGGGTLQGLGQLLLGTNDALEIDRLAMLGNANTTDLTLIEAVGEKVGSLPVDANAVNFGRLAREEINLSPPDLAAGLVRLVAQVIAVIAINAAKSQQLDSIVFTGHLVDLKSICKVLNEVAGYYGAHMIVPRQPGAGTAIGALICLEASQPDEQTLP
jgi:type II pantothenate kinase